MVELKRFLFFASVYQVQDLVASVIKRTKSTADETHVPRDRIRRCAVYKAGEKVRVKRSMGPLRRRHRFSLPISNRYEDTAKKLDHVKHEEIREYGFYCGQKVLVQIGGGGAVQRKSRRLSPLTDLLRRNVVFILTIGTETSNTSDHSNTNII